MTQQPSMDQLMEKAKEMQQQMQSIQAKIAALKVTGEAGGGLVKIVMNGTHHVEKVFISPNVIGDEDMLEPLVAAAINDASDKIEKTTKDEMMRLAQDLQLPEGFGG